MRMKKRMAKAREKGIRGLCVQTDNVDKQRMGVRRIADRFHVQSSAGTCTWDHIAKAVLLLITFHFATTRLIDSLFPPLVLATASVDPPQDSSTGTSRN